MYGGYYGFPEIAADMRKTQLEHVKEVLAAVEQRAVEEGVPCTTLALEGLRGQVLCRLPTLTTHGWSWSARTGGTASAG